MRRPAYLVGLALISTLLFAGSALGAVAALEPTTVSTFPSSTNTSVPATCPAGKRLVGAGGQTLGAEGQVVLDDVTPNGALDRLTTFGAEDGNGTGADWSLYALAVCATPLPGLELVTVPSASTSSSKGVTATCPTGKRVVGAGADLIGGFGQVEIDDVVPSSGLLSVNAFAAEDGNGYSGSWSVRAHAICANPVAGLERKAQTSISGSANKDATAPCPAGKGTLGGGWELLGGGGQVLVTRALPGLEPVPLGQVEAAEDEDGTLANWTVTAYTICANASRLEANPGVATSTSPKTAFSSCPSNRQLTGLGAEITGGFGQVVLDDLTPEPALTSSTATAYEDATASSSNWSLTPYSICATPLPGLERVDATSSANSTNKSAIASCPGAKRVVGAGGRINGGVGQVTMDDVRPTSGLTSVLVDAAEVDDGTAAIWEVTAYAICADPPPGLELVSVQSETDSQEIKIATAGCPGNKNLLGLGSQLTGDAGDVMLDDLRPNGGLTRNTVTAVEDEDGTGADWSATAHAICANP